MPHLLLIPGVVIANASAIADSNVYNVAARQGGKRRVEASEGYKLDKITNYPLDKCAPH